MFSEFCLSSLLICIVIIGDRPTGLYIVFNYHFRFDLYSGY